jgi:hypothetical protein
MKNNRQQDSKNVHPNFYGANFEKAAAFSTEYLGIANALKMDSLQVIAGSFESAMSRLRAMAKLPARAAIASGALVAGVVSVLQTLQSGNPEKTLGQVLDEIKAEIDGESWKERLEACEKSGIDPLDELERILPGTAAIRDFISGFPDMLEQNVPMVSRAISTTKFPSTSEGLHALHVAQITGSWTAFETLAGDVWIAAVNARPRGLVAGMKPESKEDGTKWMSFDTLRKHRFDLTAVMGNVLAESKKVSFRTLDEIRKSYKIAFNGTVEIVNSISGRDLDALHAVRNAIVHRGGYVDKMFRDRMERDPYWSQFQVGDELPIDGEKAASLTDTSIKAAVGLIRIVDNWVLTNPDSI